MDEIFTWAANTIYKNSTCIEVSLDTLDLLKEFLNSKVFINANMSLKSTTIGRRYEIYTEDETRTYIPVGIRLETWPTETMRKCVYYSYIDDEKHILQLKTYTQLETEYYNAL